MRSQRKPGIVMTQCPWLVYGQALTVGCVYLHVPPKLPKCGEIQSDSCWQPCCCVIIQVQSLLSPKNIKDWRAWPNLSYAYLPLGLSQPSPTEHSELARIAYSSKEGLPLVAHAQVPPASDRLGLHNLWRSCCWLFGVHWVMTRALISLEIGKNTPKNELRKKHLKHGPYWLKLKDINLYCKTH